MAGIKMNPGLKAAGIDPDIVQKLVEAQKAPVNAVKARKDKTIREKEALDKLNGMLNDLDSSLSKLKSRTDFYKLKLDSSHPDIIDGTVGPAAMVGSYEFEVRDLARSDKELAFGFPDKDQTPVGFGYMVVERDDGEPVEIEIDPGDTLQNVASKINDTKAGVKAMIINTKFKPDSFRLLVVSEKSGKDARVLIDEDTTDLQFKQQVAGQNLDVLFEDVPVTSEDNVLSELVDNVTFNVRRSEPGTRVQVNIVYDVEKTLESIKAFVDKYNAVSQYINSQFKQDPQTGEYGVLVGDATIKSVLRQLQSSFGSLTRVDGKFANLSQVGISTDPKTGTLTFDETKVKGALAESYEEVAKLFVQSPDSMGIADELASKLKSFRDPGAGLMKTRLKGLQNIIQSQDKEIERRTRQLGEQEESLTRRFSNLQSTLSNLQNQGNFLKAKFGKDQDG